MGVVELRQQESNNLLKHWIDAYISPNKKSGYVATLDLSMKKHKKAYTRFFGLNDMYELLKYAERTEKPLTNVYLSLNAFKAGPDGEIRRKTDHLAQIRNIGLDIDCYNVGLTPEQASDNLKEMILRAEIPNPNLVIWSGNGLQLVYSIQGGAAPSLAWLAEYITTQLIGKTSALGADFSCADVTRVFRLPGTINKKPGKEKKRVNVEMWRALEYDLSELYDYCEPKRLKAKRAGQKAKVYDLPSIREHGRQLKSLNLSRAKDLNRLVELRNGDIEKRNVMTYDYAFSLALNDLSKTNVIEAAQTLNNRFDEPQSVKEIKRTAGRAYEDARAFWKAYKGNGYKMVGLPSRLIKPKKNQTLINEYEITADEEREMTVLIGQAVKYERKKAKRRENGMKTMEEYNSSRKAQKAERIAQLTDLLQDNPTATQRELAALMGVSAMTVSRLLKQLTDNK